MQAPLISISIIGVSAIGLFLSCPCPVHAQMSSSSGSLGGYGASTIGSYYTNSGAGGYLPYGGSMRGGYLPASSPNQRTTLWRNPSTPIGGRSSVMSAGTSRGGGMTRGGSMPSGFPELGSTSGMGMGSLSRTRSMSSSGMTRPSTSMSVMPPGLSMPFRVPSGPASSGSMSMP